MADIFSTLNVILSFGCLHLIFSYFVLYLTVFLPLFPIIFFQCLWSVDSVLLCNSVF